MVTSFELEAAVERAKAPDSKEMEETRLVYVMTLVEGDSSLTLMEEIAPAEVSVSVPQEKRPPAQRSFEVRAVLQVVRPEPKRLEEEE